MLLLRLLNRSHCRPVWPTVPQRTFQWHTSTEMEALLKRSDRVPKSYELVYRQKHYRAGAIMYHAVIAMACASFGSLGYFWYKRYRDPSYKMPAKVIQVYKPFESFCAVALNAGMIMMAVTIRSRWPLRIYHDSKRDIYRVVLNGWIPFTKEFREFSGKSLAYVAKGSILPWRTSLFRNDTGYKILLFEGRFKSPYYFHQMLKPNEL